MNQLRLISMVCTLFSLTINAFATNDNNQTVKDPQIKNLQIADPSVESAIFSVTVVDSKNESPIYLYNNTTPLLPASNVKLLTTMFALDSLHPDFHYTTKLYMTGTVKKHTLYGDLYVKGGADPSFTVDDYKHLLAKLKELKITHINGDIILDSTIFNSTSHYSMLTNDKYDPDTLMPSGLMINKGYTNIKFKLNKKHGFTANSDLYGYHINSQNLYLTDHQNSCDDLFDNVKVNLTAKTISLSGILPKSCNQQTLTLYLLPNDLYNTVATQSVLHSLKIKLKGGIKSGRTSANATLISSRDSDTLDQLIIHMNKYSDNIYAETLPLIVAATLSKNNDTYKEGIAELLTYLKNKHIANNNSVIENGAGLSRHEKYSSRQLVDLLIYASHSPYYTIFEKSLPVPNTDGTLKNSFSQFATRLKAKTGTLNDSHAYSGYFYAKNGQKYLISIIANNINTNDNLQMKEMDAWVTRLLTALDKN